MAVGRKTGGRQKGTPNRRTQEIIEKLDTLGCDPIEGMARIAMDESNTVELRGRMYAELAHYVFPKRKAIEHSGDIGRQYVARMPEVAESAEEWERRNKPTIN